MAPRSFVGVIPMNPGLFDLTDGDEFGNDDAMFSALTIDQDGQLSDELYRLVIKAKIVKNNGDATIENILSGMNFLLPNAEVLRITDGEDMSFSIEFYGEITDLQRFALLNAKLVPKPQAVRFNGFLEGFGMFEFGDIDAEFGDDSAEFVRHIRWKMALKLNERYPGRFDNPSASYPQGSFKNRTTPTAKDGSYLEKDWANDKEGFFQSLLSAALIAANGSVDRVGASQYYDALLAVMKTVKSIQVFTANGNFLVPAGVYLIWVSGCAGGGGGGSSLATNSTSFVTGGSGGGAGQSVLRFPIAVTPGQIIPVIIGAAGTGATSFPANYGGPQGGAGYPGGSYATDTCVFSANTATGANGGLGGISQFGSPGSPGRGASNESVSPLPGSGYGAGGSGAGGAYTSTISAPGKAGADGLPGILEIEW